MSQIDLDAVVAAVKATGIVTMKSVKNLKKRLIISSNSFRDGKNAFYKAWLDKLNACLEFVTPRQLLAGTLDSLPVPEGNTS